jgi:1,4-dihydroxy-2-naphthoate octaprenyltransferase
MEEMSGEKVSRLRLLFRLTRVQFLPVMIAPIVLGFAVSWFTFRMINPFLALLVLTGSIFLHLAANSIDDVYDFVNGVDTVSDKLFPREFPGWKPIPRGLVSVGQGLAISFAFYMVSLSIGIYLSFAVGWLSLIIAVPGILLSYFYAAPPLKLDYRGLGLGELAILLSFGPIPALGAFYVLTGTVSILPVVAAIPTGLLTADILITHDMIFYDAYRAAGKRSLAVMFGRIRAARLVMALGVSAYAIVVASVAVGYFPASSLVILAALPLLLKGKVSTGQELPPPAYAKKTLFLFLHSVTFTLLLGLGFVL